MNKIKMLIIGIEPIFQKLKINFKPTTSTYSAKQATMSLERIGFEPMKKNISIDLQSTTFSHSVISLFIYAHNKLFALYFYNISIY